MKRFSVTVRFIELGRFQTNITAAEKSIKYLETLWENLDGETKESYGIEYYEKGIYG